MRRNPLQIRPGTRKLALTGLLGALAIALSAAESLFPPLPFLPPGAKPGLSNIAAMFAAGQVGLGPALCIALIKAGFAGVTRGVTALLMSLAGGVCSTLVMAALLRMRKRPWGLMGVGIAGALTHNLAQLAVAATLVSSAFLTYLPWLLVFAVITGSLTGILLRALWPALQKLAARYL